MSLTLGEWTSGFSAPALEEVASLWNANAVDRHAFYPWSGTRMASLLDGGPGQGGTMFEARADGRLVGFCHVGTVAEDGYPAAGVVEALLVDSAYRKRGIGTSLLKGAITFLSNHRPRLGFVDALGAWPFGYLYNVLADGSERSGVFLNEPGLYRLFRRANFHPVKKSLVMRTDVSPHRAGSKASGDYGFYVARRTDRTWLDRVFRGRHLWDHDMVDRSGQVLSRSIFGLMEGESRHEGKAIFSIFGVNTPIDLRGRGHASRNLAHLLAHMAEVGGEVAELHVYADNAPALALYRGLGFQPVAETMMMHRLL